MANGTDALSETTDQLSIAIERWCTGAGKTCAEIEASEAPVRKVETELPQGWRRNFGAWVKAHSLRAARNITATTKAIFDDVVSQASAEERLSISELTKLLLGRVASRARAVTIARTEIVTASNYSADLTAREIAAANGITYDKYWLSAADERTRASHVAANGQKADAFGFFTVGGYRMSHPCDSDQGAPASEIINCRCTCRRKYLI
jgi:hypothetical protein